MKGIILAGGLGTRLYPATLGVSKQLIPVYDKPMVYYPLSVLMLAGIRNILVIHGPHDYQSFHRILGDGSQLGISISYACQSEPRGIADAFIVAESFIDKDPVTLILGDNIFYGAGFQGLLHSNLPLNQGCTIFGYNVAQPEAYGVVSFDNNGQIKNIIEKPQMAPSNIAITGLYIYDGSVCERARNLQPSSRGELEVTDLNNSYLRDGTLNLVQLPRGFAWLDTGTHESLIEASEFVRVVEKSQNLKIGCIEEVAFRNKWIDQQHLRALAKPLLKTSYGSYLQRLSI